MNNKKTDEQLIEAVNQYMEKYPNASRNHIILHATGSAARVRELAKQGLIKLEVEKQSSISPFQECLNLVGECFI